MNEQKKAQAVVYARQAVEIKNRASRREFLQKIKGDDPEMYEMVSEEMKELSKSRVEKLISLLNGLISLKGKIRGAKRSLKCCKRSIRRAEKWNAAATKAAEEKSAADEKAAADAKAASLHARREAHYRERLNSLRKEREDMVNAAKRLIAEIGGYRRRDRKEVMRLRVAVGI